MLCERCKIREATIQYTEIINGTKREHSFCAQCAQEVNLGQFSALFDGDFPFSKILSALLGEDGQAENAEYAQILCPRCGTSYQEFLKNSRFGCPDCYEVFDILIRDSIKQLQGSETHKGKRPKYGLRMVPESLTKELPGGTENGGAAEKRVSGAVEEENKGAAEESAGGKNATGETRVQEAAERRQSIEALRRRLKQAVREEAYAEAAQYRDQIRALEKEERADA